MNSALTMRPHWAILFLSLAIGVAATSRALAQDFPADKAPEVLSIATWNLEWFFDANPADNQSKIAHEQAAPNEAAWKWKRDTIAASIAKMQPSIIALQEIEGKGVLHELTKALKDNHKISYRIAYVDGFDGATEQDVGILFQNGCVEYSRREQNSKMFESKIFYSLSKHLLAKFEWDANGHEEGVTLLNLHLRAREEASAERIKQAKLAHYLLRDRITAGENVVMLGDVNLESKAGILMANDDGIESLTGRDTPSKDDDLIDLNTKLPPQKSRTHLVLDRQFDRILVSRSMIEDAPNVKDWVFQKIEVVSEAVVRGTESVDDHWEKRYTKPIAQREPSDHFPVMATFQLK
ncbi:MAG: endonuclease [Pirellulaceae bacterium]|nr:endonuclease [Pirellulaceae bacterium]